MKSFISLVLFLTFSFSAHSFNLGQLFGGNQFKECESFKTFQFSPQEAFQKAFKQATHCQRAELLSYATRSSSKGSQFHQQASRHLVEAAYAAKDTVLTINEANLFLDLYSNTADGMNVHYMLLLAQKARIPRNINNDPRPHQIAAGLLPEQVQYQEEVRSQSIETSSGLIIEINRKVIRINNPNFDEYLYRRSYASFLNAYSDTTSDVGRQMISNIFTYLDQALLRVQEKDFSVGKYYFDRNEYLAAFGRFKSVTNAGPVILSENGLPNFQAWDKAARYTALTFAKFALAVLGNKPEVRSLDSSTAQNVMDSVLYFIQPNSYLIPNKKVAYWLQLDGHEYQPEKNPRQPSRKELAEVALKNVGLIVREMKAQRGDSEELRLLLRSLNQANTTRALRSIFPNYQQLMGLN